MKLRLGTDFDNTLVNYDGLFHRAAVERGLVPAETPPTKNSVRDHLRAVGREAAWTRLQGLVYGSRLHEAPLFPHARACLARMRQEGVAIFIVSHKTRFPHAGPPFDLHAAARDWLVRQGLSHQGGIIEPQNVYFETSLAAKLHRVATLGCHAFVDDLPEVLTHTAFPDGVQRIWFDPAGQDNGNRALVPVRSWQEIGKSLRIAS